MASIDSAQTTQVPTKEPKIHTKFESFVRPFAKVDSRKRWWCPRCCSSVTKDHDLTRHYKEHHPEFVDENKNVFAAEKENWVEAQYLDTRHATEDEKEMARCDRNQQAQAVAEAGQVVARQDVAAQVMDEVNGGQGPQVKLPNTPTPSTVTLKTKKVTKSKEAPQAATANAAAAVGRLIQFTAIDIGEDMTFDKLIAHAQVLFGDILKVTNGLQAVKEGEKVAGQTFNTMVDTVITAMDVVAMIQHLALNLKPAESEDEEENSEEEDGGDDKDAQANGDTDIIMTDSGGKRGSDDSDSDEYDEDPEYKLAKYNKNDGVPRRSNLGRFADNDLATAPSFAEWTSVQMFLHAAELRWMVFENMRDHGVGSSAVQKEAEEWEIEGIRRKKQEDAGEREGWNWGHANLDEYEFNSFGAPVLRVFV